MATSARGTKRTDPDTGKKFYDLDLDPIVSPYTGKSYPRSFFEQLASGKAVSGRKVEKDDETEDETEDAAAPEIVSLEDADAEESTGEDIPDVEDVEVDEDLANDEQDAFLEDDEDADDSLGFEVGDDEDN